MIDRSAPDNAESEERRFVLGMGCERSASSADVLALAERALSEAGIAAGQVAAVTSIAARAGEPAILAVAAHLGVPARFFDAQTLERETPRLINPSDLVFAHVGCHGVAEAAALAAAGPSGDLVVPKIRSGSATAAVAQFAPPPVDG